MADIAATPRSFEPASPRARRKLPATRTVSLTAGLILFAYAATHLLSHATGLLGLDGMERVGRGFLLAPWRTDVGRAALLGSLLAHGGLGVAALWRRRHLAMPAAEAFQLGLGLTIPLLLLPHLTNVRAGNALYNLDDSYYRIVYQYWITSPVVGLTRQFLLMAVLWTHGCIGLRMWLRLRPWWPAWSGWLLAIAVAIPALAMLGIVNAGWDTTFRAMLTPGFAAQHGPPAPGTAAAGRLQDLDRLWQSLQLAYVALLAGVFGARAWRARRARERGGLTIRFPDRVVVVPRGFSILEASRVARLPHVSVCGGRARCSTCRVEVVDGLAHLSEPEELEQATLQRIRAPPTVRLACQTRPLGDVSVVPLVPTRARRDRGSAGDLAERREGLVTALAVDLRESTRLAHENLPFDALYVVDEYLRIVVDAARRHDGSVVSVAGDGVMSVFGGEGDPKQGALSAFEAALEVWRGLEKLDASFRQDLRTSVRFGMGLHAGVAILAGAARRGSIEFLGDTGNVASRLEALTKEKGCTAIVSANTLALAGLARSEGMREEFVQLRGREAGMPALLLADSETLAEALRIR